MKSFLDMLKENLSSTQDNDVRFLTEDEIINEGLGDIWAKVKSKVKASKLGIKKFGEKMFAWYTRGPKREQGVIDPASGHVAVKWVNSSRTHACVMVNPAVYSGMSNKDESTSIFGKMINEIMTPDEVRSDAEKEIGSLGRGIGAVEDPSDKDMYRTGVTDTSNVDFSDLDEILENVAYGLKYRKKYTEDVPSILLMGPPGAGKTSIVKQFAKRKKMNLKIMEIASLYKEMLGGFPVIEKVLAAGIDPATLSPEERANLTDAISQSVVKVKQADLLPPSGDTRPWILFLDEFNRDAEKMAAAMNLILTGNIGDAYYLPLKTIVIAAGNLGKDIDGVDVAAFDSATWDRFNRKVKLDYDRSASAKHAEDENALDDEGEEDFTPPNIKKGAETVNNDGEEGIEYFTKRPEGLSVKDKMVSSLYNFVFRKNKEEGTNDWKLPLQQFNPDADAILTPRTLNKIDKDLKIKAIKDWDEDKLIGSHDKKWYEDNYEAKGFKSPISYYLHVNQWKEQFLPKHLTQALGPTGGATAQDMLAKHYETKKELDLSSDDIVYNWTVLKDENNNKDKAANYIGQVNLEGAGSIIALKSEAALKKMVDKSPQGKKVVAADFEGDYPMYVATNLHNYYKAAGGGAGSVEEVTAFLDQLAQSESYQNFLKDSDKDKFRKIPVVAIISCLLDASPLFQEAWNNIADNIQADKTVKSKAAKFAAQDMFINGTKVPEWFAKATPDKARQQAISVSSMLYSGARMQPKEKKPTRKTTDESLDIALRNVLKRL